MASVQIILVQRVEHLGPVGKEVKVRAGYARNFLLPRGKAIRATPENRKVFELKRDEWLKRDEELRRGSASIQEVLDGEWIFIASPASESGQLYGSVAARDIVEQVNKKLLNKREEKLGRDAVRLDKPVKSHGVHPVLIRLHADVAATIMLSVATSVDIAENQRDAHFRKLERLEQEAREEKERAIQQAQDDAAASAKARDARKNTGDTAKTDVTANAEQAESMEVAPTTGSVETPSAASDAAKEIVAEAATADSTDAADGPKVPA